MAAIGNSPTQQAFTPAIDYFSGNGSTTAFTLSRPVASVAQVQVTIDNVAQNPSSAYTVSSNTITFTSAPLSGTNNIYVYYTSPITQVIAPGQGTVTSDSFGTITNFTTTGNTVLGDATTDTLTVGVTGIVKDSSGNVGIGTASPNVGGLTRALTLNAPTGGNYAGFELAGAGTQTARFVANNTATYFGTTPATPLVFETNNAERMRLNTTGALVLAGGSTSASGVGITFPTTQSASSNANTLDDYEEGTWTPGLSFGGGTTGITYTTQSGGYIKVGAQVTVWAYILLSSKGSSTGVARATGLPFTNVNAPGRSEGATASFNYWTNMNGTPAPLGYVQDNATTIYIDNGVGANTTGSIDNTNFNNNTALYFNATYSIV